MSTKSNTSGSAQDNDLSSRVIAVVGPDSSRQCATASGVFGLYHVPSLGLYASSDELSNKLRYRYFLRLVPTDSWLVVAIIDTLLALDWTYVSLVYEEGSFGEYGGKHFQKLANLNGICIAYSYMLTTSADQAEFDETVEQLVHHRKAKAVVLFTGFEKSGTLFRTVSGKHLGNRFIWMGGIPFHAFYKYLNVLHGAFYYEFSTGVDDEFIEYMSTFDVTTAMLTPWYRDLWQQVHHCTWNSNFNNSCEGYDRLPERDMTVSYWPIKMRDGIYTIAHAAHNLINESCPDAFHNTTLLTPACINGPALLTAIKNLSFSGISEHIQFDARGNILGSYTIKQMVLSSHAPKEIGRWDKYTNNLTLHVSEFEWTGELALWQDDRQLPESVCSKPCPVRQYTVRLESVCCWLCKSCRENERIINGTQCEQCRPLTWPDEENATTCISIDADYLSMSDSPGMALAIVSSLGVSVGVAIVVFFIIHRQTKLIKASSRELSLLILTGVIFSYTLVYFALVEPSKWSCQLSRLGFDIAMTLMYGPLTVKTNRVYRVFRESMRGNKRPSLISTKTQVVMSCAIILCQVSNHSIEVDIVLDYSRQLYITSVLYGYEFCVAVDH